MDTAQLKAFLRIADTGSISRAADSLGIAQPSLSQQLLRLEDEIGTRLFDRTARGVTLTVAGRMFREGAQRVLHASEQALADTRELREEAHGQVVLAMPPSVAQLLGAELVKELATSAPLVRARIVEAYSGATRGWIETEKIDLGIVYETKPLRHLMTTHLADDELVIVAGRSHRLADAVRQGVSFGDLANEVWIAPGRQHGLRHIFDSEAARAGLQLNIGYEIDSLATTIELVSAGVGVALLPYCATLDARWAGQIRTARVGHDGLYRRLSVVRNPAHVLTHACVRVATLVGAVMARMIADGSWQATIDKN